ncbi:hypothetical protein [Halomonas litopenaei]|uniref:hypothetical protein n=1 Tax=Halomonas litopenaei TaxID=2109328 RepID=UPI001A8E0B38|nr:hypothetical protein [Halomonas litopenaei]MBN8414019.1 hypothetical protein [Halomonas litopenaei]
MGSLRVGPSVITACRWDERADAYADGLAGCGDTRAPFAARCLRPMRLRPLRLLPDDR